MVYFTISYHTNRRQFCSKLARRVLRLRQLKAAGFTLVELLVVIAIIGILLRL